MFATLRWTKLTFALAIALVAVVLIVVELCAFLGVI
jgi:hypothetical protein